MGCACFPTGKARAWEAAEAFRVRMSHPQKQFS